MPDNEEPTPDATTELPPVQPVPVAAVAPPVAVAPAPVVVDKPSGHSTTKVLLAAGAGALVVFLIAAAGILGYAIGTHSNNEGGIRPARLAQLQENLGNQYGQRGQDGPFGPGMGRGPGYMGNQQQGGSQSYPQGQQGTMPQFPVMPGQQSGGMMGQVPSP